MKKFSTAALATLALAGVALAAAVAIGGFSLLTTRGISMLPGLEAGDLAVLRPASVLAVGDVAAYRSPSLRSIVLHRVTQVDGDRYSFQGDNNSWTDPEQPTSEGIVGKLVFRVPHGGVWLDRATSPPGLVLLSLIFVLGGGTTSVITRRQRKRQRRASSAAAAAVREHLALPAPIRTAAAASLSAALIGAAVAALTWNVSADPQAPLRPAEPPKMTFSYMALVAPSAAYDGTTVTQPQPVFRKVADSVYVTLAYDGAPATPADAIRVTAKLSTAGGWQSNVTLPASGARVGDRVVSSVALELDELQRRADAGALASGTAAGGDVAVTLVAEITRAGEAAFRPELPFILDTVALRLAGGADTPLTLTAPSAVQDRPKRDVPAPVAALLRVIPLGLVRAASVVVLVAALLVLAAVSGWARRARHAPEHRRIQQAYPHLLMTIEPVVLPPGRSVIDVPGPSGLVRLAQRYGLLIMHWHRGGVHTYVVFEENTTYRYRCIDALPPNGEQPAARSPGVSDFPLDSEPDVSGPDMSRST